MSRANDLRTRARSSMQAERKGLRHHAAKRKEQRRQREAQELFQLCRRYTKSDREALALAMRAINAAQPRLVSAPLLP